MFNGANGAGFHGLFRAAFVFRRNFTVYCNGYACIRNAEDLGAYLSTQSAANAVFVYRILHIIIPFIR